MGNASVKDGRGYFILPQAPEQSGYYVYGTPSGGAGQYAHPTLLSLILMVEHRWQGMDARKFGVGNISLADGTHFSGHSGHRDGLNVDVRPLRKDGKEIPVRWSDKQYDRDATEKLIGLFWSFGAVRTLYFNDLSIANVKFAARHDDHFHVDVKV